MKKTFYRIISSILVFTTLFFVCVPAFAVENEEYLSDLRIIYADDFEEAKAILDDCVLEGYSLFNENLNANTGKTGVWLAYKTTTDIEDAITDIAVMQMNGGYNEGNYQEMIKNSYNEYLEFGENYLVAIDYFNDAYNAGHYLSEIAYRQLNFYNVVTEGIDEIPDFEGERLGDIFYNGIDAGDLATMFMEGNSYALTNIRSLIAMGVSYNEDGKTYLEKVGDEVDKLNANPNAYDNEDYGETAALIAPVFTVFRDMFKELSVYEEELDYTDGEFTELEMKYIEYMYMANMMRKVVYLGGKTLYDFCLEYTAGSDYTNLYPLVAALNDGQLAMTKVNHYYDVVRYSTTIDSDEELNAKLDELEANYGDNPFNIYEGVDRTIYRDTFALTSEAYRADAFTESGLSAYLTDGAGDFGKAMNMVGLVGVGIVTIGLVGHFYTKVAINTYDLYFVQAKSKFLASTDNVLTINGYTRDYYSIVNDVFDELPEGLVSVEDYNTMTIGEKFDYLDDYFQKTTDIGNMNKANFDLVKQKVTAACTTDKTVSTAYNDAVAAQQTGSKVIGVAYGMYIVGGLMALVSAIRLGFEIYNYYHPEYDDIPTAMVDLIDTKDGDRYIKYDVVYEAEYNEDGGYSAADLNAFSANRWNALYYTKSYEAGKPLLADEFKVSYNNNTPDKNYAPVHRFGEVVSYNLNKYNFNDNQSIYLSVKQSDNNKFAASGVPELVGSVFSTGYAILAGGLGAIVGAGGTIGVGLLAKKRKETANTEAEATE